MAGISASLPWGKQVNNTATPSFGGVGGGTKNAGIGGVYSGAVHQQAGDYDKIMKNYQDMYSQGGPGGSGRINPQKVGFNPIPGYQQSSQLSGLYGQLGGMSKTGGYSEEDIGNLRERGVAPTRAIYANAMRNMQRQKSLSGGYSPNFGALQAKMAREQAGIIGGQNTAINADIAEKVAQGKQFALGQMSPIAMQGDRFNTDINTKNALEKQRVDEFNARNAYEADTFNQGNQLEALRGMQSLYSATPGLVNTFGQQALSSGAQNLQGEQARAGIQQNRANLGLQAIGNLQQPQSSQQQQAISPAQQWPPPPQMLNNTMRTRRISGQVRPGMSWG